MKSLLLFLLSISCLPHFSYAQSAGKGQLMATVTDAANNTPLPYVTLSVLKPDGSLAGGGIGDEGGQLSVSIPYGNDYQVLIQFMGYEAYVRNGVDLNSENAPLNLGNIGLEAVARRLQEVEVQAQQMEMQLSLDKKVFNVSDNLATKGGSATDILENIPSVSVDVEGNVSLRGSDNVRILINGKPSGLTGANALRQLPSDLIERVEVITNPSARYEAQGMAGIINIILKKNQEKGLNGSFELSTGWPHNHGLGANVNVRRKDVNFFVNLNSRYRKYEGGGFNYSTFSKQQFDTLDNDFGYSFYERNQNRAHKRGGWSHNIRLGSDFYLNQKNVVTAAFLFNKSYEDNLASLTYDFLVASQQPVLFSERTDNEQEEEENLEWNLDYRRTYDEKDKVLSATVQYRKETEAEGSDYEEFYYLPNGELAQSTADRQRSDNVEKNEELLFQLDFVDPLPGDLGKWEAGARSSFRNIGNDYAVSFYEDGTFVKLAPFSNQFNYEEQVHAGYLQAGLKHERWSYQAGLRSEYTFISTAIDNTVNDRSFFNLFPSAFVTYKLSDLASVQASYSRRIRRPGFRRLNPFLTFSDARNLRIGNPALNPEFTDSYELGYLHNWSKLSLTSSLFYRHTIDGIQYLQSVADYSQEIAEVITGGPATQSMPFNISQQNDLGIEFVLSADLTNWWTMNGSYNIFYSQTDDFSYVRNEETRTVEGVETWASQGRFSSRMRFTNGLNLQQTLFYRAPQKNLQGSRLSLTFVSLGASKDILKNKGTLAFTLDDVFNSRKWRSETITDSFTSDSEFQWRKRTARLTFTYRLRQEKKRGKRSEDGREGGDEMMEF